MLPSISIVAILAALAQISDEPSKDAASTAAAKQRAAERLEFMKKSVTVYKLALVEETRDDAAHSNASAVRHRVEVKLAAVPLLRWSNIHGEGDGTLFLWTAARRPVAIAQM